MSPAKAPKAKMTPEQRTAAAKVRAAEKDRIKKEFPGAVLRSINSDSGVIVEVEAGEDLWLNVRKRGKWQEDSRFPASWEQASISILDPEELIRFIRALSARYNAIVKRMKCHRRQCPDYHC